MGLMAREGLYFRKAATDFRQGGRIYLSFFYSLFRNAIVTEIQLKIKSVSVCQGLHVKFLGFGNQYSTAVLHSQNLHVPSLFRRYFCAIFIDSRHTFSASDSVSSR